MNEATRGQVWMCVHCKRERIWGSAKIGDENKTAHLKCAHCGPATMHVYVRYSFQSLYDMRSASSISESA